MTTVLVIRGGTVGTPDAPGRFFRSCGHTTSASRAGSVQDDGDGLRPGRADPLSGVPDAVFHLDRTWVITYVNPAAESLLGRRADAMLGQPALEAVPGLRGTRLQEAFAAVFADDRPRVFEYLHERWDHWFEMRIHPDASGLIAIVRDIDERKRADGRRDDEARELTAVLEAL